MTYSIPNAKRRIKELGGNVRPLASHRHVPPNGRAYSIKRYEVSLAGVPPVQLDEFNLRALSVAPCVASALRSHASLVDELAAS